MNKTALGKSQTEAQVRSWVAQWTPGRIRSLEYEAKSGILKSIGDLCDNLLSDDRIKAVLGVRVNGLLGLPIEFHLNKPYDDKNKPKVIEALEEDFWTMYPESALAELLSWSLLVGIGIAQHVWTKNKKTGRLEPHLDVWHPSNTGYDLYHDSWFVSTKNGKEFITHGEGNWIIYAPFGLKRPWTWGLWRILSRWWLLKQYAITDWARHSEAHGKPAYILKTISEEAFNNQQIKRVRADLVGELQSIGELQALALPYGFDVELLEAKTTASEVFNMQIDKANDGIAIAILGQNLTTSVNGGSLAAARVHEQVRGDIKEFDEQTFSTVLHNQSIKWWCEVNFGKKQEVPWVRWDTEEPEDANTKAQRDKARSETMVKVMEFIKEAKSIGMPVDVPAIAAVFEIPLNEFLEEEVVQSEIVDEDEAEEV